MRVGVQQSDPGHSSVSKRTQGGTATAFELNQKPRIPAVIFSSGKTAELEIATLTVLDRLIVAVHRAGAGPIIVVTDDALPDLKRTRALRIPICVESQAPRMEAPVFVASANVLIQVGDVRRCLAEHGALLSTRGQPLCAGLVDSIQADFEPALGSIPRLIPEGVACLVEDAASARAAEAALWASLTSSSDGFVDKVFNRPCGRPLSKLLIRTPVSPNAISLVSILMGVGAAILFSVGQYQTAILAALVFQLSAIIDCVDGDVARVLCKESVFGKWLDLAGDQIVHVSVFAGVALGVVHASAGRAALWLGASAMAGALISFAVVVRGMRLRSGENQRLQRLIDSATNRDFSVLVFVLASLEQLELFLWLAAVGSHLFWMTALSLQVGRKPSVAPGR